MGSAFTHSVRSPFKYFFQFFLGDRPAPVTYVPPEPSDSEETLFRTIAEGINFDKYDAIPVEVSGDNPVKPINTFDEAHLYETFLANVKKAHYHKPTPVQKYAIPSILAGRDVMACAQTGSGKTVSIQCCVYVIP